MDETSVAGQAVAEDGNGRGAHRQSGGKSRIVQQSSLAMHKHRLQALQRLCRNPASELRDIALQVGADEIPAKGEACLVRLGEEAVRAPPRVSTIVLWFPDRFATSSTSNGFISTYSMRPARLSRDCRSKFMEADPSSRNRPLRLPRRRPLSMSPPQFLDKLGDTVDPIEDNEAILVALKEEGSDRSACCDPHSIPSRRRLHQRSRRFSERGSFSRPAAARWGPQQPVGPRPTQPESTRVCALRACMAPQINSACSRFPSV
jgi:hypothetical protein